MGQTVPRQSALAHRKRAPKTAVGKKKNAVFSDGMGRGAGFLGPAGTLKPCS